MYRVTVFGTYIDARIPLGTMFDIHREVKVWLSAPYVAGEVSRAMASVSKCTTTVCTIITSQGQQASCTLEQLLGLGKLSSLDEMNVYLQGIVDSEAP